MWQDFTFMGALGQGPNDAVTRQEYSDLLKSIDAGADIATGGADPSGFALRPQSLEQTLVLQTFKDQDIVAWKEIPKERAFSTVEEYDRLQSYGPERINPFMPEGSLPFADDASYTREYATVKFMGTLRAVSHQMGLVRSLVGDQVAKETANGTLWLMRAVEKSLFFGDSSTVGTQWNGMLAQLKAAILSGAADSDSLVDIRSVSDNGLGGSITMDICDAASEYVRTQFGKITSLHYGTTAHRNFSTNLLNVDGTNKYSGVRGVVNNLQGGPLVPGWTLKTVATQFGDWEVKPNVFLNPVKQTEAGLTAGEFAQGDASLRPGVPSISISEQNTSDAKFGSQTGDYDYIVVAINAYGNSVGTAASTGTVTSGVKTQRVAISKGSGGTPTGYIVFRTAKGGSAFYEIARVAYSGSSQNFDDKNENIAGTGFAFGITDGPDVWAFKQLAPFMKVPLATIDLRTRWVQLLYGTPVLKSPRKVIIFKNVL